MISSGLSDELADLSTQFEGYHLEICIYPSGGMVTAWGCSECGTEDDIVETVGWKWGQLNGKPRTPHAACTELLRRIK